MSLKILHIAGGGAQHTLYRQLVERLSDVASHQLLFAPVRTIEEKRRQPKNPPGSVEYHFSHILKPYHRVLFRTKIKKIIKYIFQVCEPNNFDIFHAHTMYSDGAVALTLKKITGLPFVVSIRNTDVNVFMRLRPDLQKIGYSVLKEASSIIFLSPTYRDKFAARLSESMLDNLQEKFRVIPNGLGSSWLDYSPGDIIPRHNQIKLLFVGNLSKNKNVHSLLRATEILAQQKNLIFTIVGGGGNYEKRILQDIRKAKYSFVRYLGKIQDKEKLRLIYRDHHIFVMPSFSETFGVVYIEALSQGIPVIHSHGQGVDGYFRPNTVSEPVNPHNIEDIAKGIESIEQRLPDIKMDCICQAQRFSWYKIAEDYLGIYGKAIR